jgi:hypothetical protein
MLRRYWKLGAVGISCAAIGLGASAIAGAGAATTGSPTAGNAPAGAKHRAGGTLLRRHLLARAVHGELVVPTKSGFETITFDRGVVQSVNGQQITLTEGTANTHRTVTLTLPAGARVRDNGKPATLADVKSGQRAIVVQGPKRTLVRAHDRRTG